MQQCCSYNNKFMEHHCYKRCSYNYHYQKNYLNIQQLQCPSLQQLKLLKLANAAKRTHEASIAATAI